MATSRVALLGSPKGPWVPLVHLENPHLRVRGVKKDTLVRARVLYADGQEDGIAHFDCDGVFPLRDGAWLMVECEGDHAGVICHAVSVRAA